MSQSEINAYIAQLTPQEQKVLKIAQEHLESSFNLVKSIGFKEWQQTHKDTQTTVGVPTTTTTATGKISIKPLILSKL
jgi:hypothetical protein